MTDEMRVSRLEQQWPLATNILLFCRTLRAGGLPIGPGQVIEALAAVRTAGLERPDDLCWALRSVLVTDPRHFELFRQAFRIYFRRPSLLSRVSTLLLPDIEAGEERQPEAAVRRLMEAFSPQLEDSAGESGVVADRSASWSRREVLRRKDFEQMTLAEQTEARQLLRSEIAALRDVPTRRYRPSAYGRRYDLRRTMQSMVRTNGQLTQLARKRRAVRPPPLVLICDISGSMSQYSRAFLHFAHALTAKNQTVHTFVFGTRLTNVTHRLREKDVDTALAQVSRDVKDWDGGTRIAESLKRFNIDWNRRVLAQNAVVILLSDGLERDTASSLEFQMQRLRASCRQLIWLNPVLRYREFEPRAGGIRKMLPHVDRFLPAHNIESLRGLIEILSGHGEAPDGKVWKPPAESAA